MGRRAARAYLERYHFRHSNLGYEYILLAIEACQASPNLRHEACNLYREVGLHAGASMSSVERGICHAIETSDIQRMAASELIAWLLDALVDENEPVHAMNMDEPKEK